MSLLTGQGPLIVQHSYHPLVLALITSDFDVANLILESVIYWHIIPANSTFCCLDLSPNCTLLKRKVLDTKRAERFT